MVIINHWNEIIFVPFDRIEYLTVCYWVLMNVCMDIGVFFILMQREEAAEEEVVVVDVGSKGLLEGRRRGVREVKAKEEAGIYRTCRAVLSYS